MLCGKNGISSTPYSRGFADAWYSRPFNPHYHDGVKIEETDMTEEQITAYRLGYQSAHSDPHMRKDWG